MLIFFYYLVLFLCAGVVGWIMGQSPSSIRLYGTLAYIGVVLLLSFQKEILF